MKKRISALFFTMLLIVSTFSLSACTKGDKNYFNTISSYSFWENSGAKAVAQYHVYDHVNNFLSDTKIVDGNAVAENGKIKKVLFIGFDGMRADALTNVLHDENNFDTNGYHYNADYSAFNELRKTGGVYIAYCGGEKGKDSEQSTSTSASWTSQFTGVWGNKHGIKENDDSKNMKHKTFMLEYAEKGLSSTIAFDWDPYFDTNLKEEVKYVMAHPEIKMTFCDTDRDIRTQLEEEQTESLDFYNFTAPESPSEYAPYDLGMRDYIAQRIENGDDIVCGIFHNIDSNGHTYEFSNNCAHYVNSVRNNDTYAYDLIKLINEREEKHNEEWLIVMANDHGGRNRGHGEQTLEERTTWIATNIKLDEKYYSSNYNGFNEKG